MPEIKLEVTSDMTSAEILALLDRGQRLHVTCQGRQFSNWLDFYPCTAEALDEIRKERTHFVRDYYAIPAGDVPHEGPFRV